MEKIRPADMMTTNPLPTAVVIDLFHTLVDPEDFRPKEFKRADFICRELQLDAADFSEFWLSDAAKERERAGNVIDLLSDYLGTLGRPIDRLALERIDTEYGRYQGMAIRNPRPHVVPSLKRLRGMNLKLGLLSNTTEQEVREWPASELASFFDAACFSCAIGWRKPHPRAYQSILRMLGNVDANRAMFVGDGGGNELHGAREAGFREVIFMKGFIVEYDWRSAEEVSQLEALADVTVYSLEELAELLEKRQG